MSYQRLKCPKGHTFRAYVTSRSQRVECPDCKRTAGAISNPTYTSHSDFSFPASSVGYDSGSSSSSSLDSFSSGGGGDFGGGGSSGDW